ncbi:hypothetical protein [Catenuloplanes japonicus]|uniref:hypothetical protein n=1 Tax=Catenuloplanes japonicus TaxID=33876 RepID=UPI0012F95F00|nr:hypothetical protein [Catenuloplanes japonicus]
MRSFDDALERLITDPAFAAALAADPDRALSGYALSPDEAALLRSQVASGPGDGVQSAVEARTNQSSVFGLFNLDGFGTAPPSSDGFGAAPPHSVTGGAAPTGYSITGGTAPHSVTGGAAPTGYSLAGGAASSGFGEAPPAAQGFGGELQGFGGDLPAAQGPGGLPAAQGAGDLPVPEGYQTRVDADGDGTWDAHTVRGRPGGGVEILVDRDGDGRADFIGHDVDADGIVDFADYDVDRDGTVDERLTDTDGDGWLDRRT